MTFHVPRGWTRDSDTLYVHRTGVRVQRTTYRLKEGWFLMPVDLDQKVVEFEPTPEGRGKAFEAFASGVLDVKPKRKAATKVRPKKPKVEEKKAESADEADDDGDDDS